MLAHGPAPPSSKVSATRRPAPSDLSPSPGRRRPVVAEGAGAGHRHVAGLVGEREPHPVQARHERLVVLVARRDLDLARSPARARARPCSRRGDPVLVGGAPRDADGSADVADDEAEAHGLHVVDHAGAHVAPLEARRGSVDLHRHALLGLDVLSVVDRVEADDVGAVVGVVLGRAHVDGRALGVLGPGPIVDLEAVCTRRRRRGRWREGHDDAVRCQRSSAPVATVTGGSV